jgi:hypothetical protein
MLYARQWVAELRDHRRVLCVFAAIFGYWLAGDRLVTREIFGGVLILFALVIGEVLPRLGRRGASPRA